MGEGPFDILAAQALHCLGLTERCLARANDPRCLLQEQVPLIARAAWNLDQFFATSLYERMRYQPDRAKAFELDRAMRTVSQRARALLHQQYHLWRDNLAPKLEGRGFGLVHPGALSSSLRQEARRCFDSSVFPALTPLAIDQRHPLPRLQDKSLNVAVLLTHQGTRRHLDQNCSLAIVPVPSNLNRFIPLASERGQQWLLIEELTAAHAGSLFPGFEVEQTCGFRVILGDVRPTTFVPLHLELETTASPLLERMLATTLTLGSADIHRVSGPLQLSDLAALEPMARAEAHDGRDQDLQRLSG